MEFPGGVPGVEFPGWRSLCRVPCVEFPGGVPGVEVPGCSRGGSPGWMCRGRGGGGGGLHGIYLVVVVYKRMMTYVCSLQLVTDLFPGVGDRCMFPGVGDRCMFPGVGDRCMFPGVGDRCMFPGVGDRCMFPGVGDICTCMFPGVNARSHINREKLLK